LPQARQCLMLRGVNMGSQFSLRGCCIERGIMAADRAAVRIPRPCCTGVPLP
jgi:hypothetical protein